MLIKPREQMLTSEIIMFCNLEREDSLSVVRSENVNASFSVFP